VGPRWQSCTTNAATFPACVATLTKLSSQPTTSTCVSELLLCAVATNRLPFAHRGYAACCTCVLCESAGGLQTSDGVWHDCDEVLWCTQAAAAPWLKGTGLPTGLQGSCICKHGCHAAWHCWQCFEPVQMMLWFWTTLQALAAMQCMGLWHICAGSCWLQGLPW